MATYRISGVTPALTAAHVTDALGLSPTKGWERGTGPALRSPVAEESRWSLSSGVEPEDSTELSTQVGQVLALLATRREQLWALADEGYKMDWFCYVGSHATEHAVEVSRGLLEQLVALPGDLLLDVSCEEPDED